MLAYETVKLVGVGAWDNLVESVYEKPYKFQQQGGCKSRGTHTLVVPSGDTWPEYVPEEEEDREYGIYDYVPLAKWTATDYKTWGYGDRESIKRIGWVREYYPNIDEIADDLYNRGLLEGGTYLIDIDW